MTARLAWLTPSLCLEKVDLMDDGTDCADILLNHVIPLRRGYVAVVNRGQKDINSDLSIREGLKKEEKFFRKHKVYSSDRALLSKCGTTHLATALNAMLMHHIRDCLPDLKTRIAHMVADVHKELDALGSPTHNASRSTRGAALLSLLSRFATNFGKILEGRVGQDLDTSARLNDKSNTAGGVELMGGARISYIFTQVFSGSLTSVGAFDGLTDEEIRTVICNANGTRPALFVPEVSFDILVRRQVARLEQPGIQCVDMIFDELQRIASQAEPSELTRFPVLRDRMVEVVASLLRRCVGPTQMMVSNLVKIELAYINTSHPDCK
jgi:dynamin 1-like protein